MCGKTALQCNMPSELQIRCFNEIFTLFMLLSLLCATHSNLHCSGSNNVKVVYGLYKVEEIRLVFLFYFHVYIFPLLER